MLLKYDYQYVVYSSLEKIIEENKEKYYLALRKAQQTLYTNNNKLNSWITFFLKILKMQSVSLENKVKTEHMLSSLPPLSQEIIEIAKNHGKVTVQAAEKITKANRNTIKVHIKHLVHNNKLEKIGTGKGTWYRIK
ncbi:MAG: hypothetical protein ABIA04_02645 [Pseudomonadota bacterium]